MLSVIKVDTTLMIAIIVLVGLLTHLSPQPANKPLHWEYLGVGQEMRLTTTITPNVPATANQFNVLIHSPSGKVQPKKVLFKLKSLTHEELEAIDVPLILAANDANGRLDPLTGFYEYIYSSTGPYLPFPGKWEIEMRVMDMDDNEAVFHKQFVIFEK